MKIETIEFDAFKDIMQQLDLLIPVNFAFLPLNFEVVNSKKQLLYSSEVKQIKKILTKNDININKIEKEGDTQIFLHQHDSSWLAPSLFIGVSLLSENPNAVSIAFNVLSNYLTDLFKGNPRNSTFKMEIVIETEKDKTYKKITLEGEPKNFKELTKLIKEIQK